MSVDHLLDTIECTGTMCAHVSHAHVTISLVSLIRNDIIIEL